MTAQLRLERQCRVGLRATLLKTVMPQPPKSANKKPPRKFAVIGAGMSGIACARTLLQAGHQVRLFERNETVGGRMASVDTPFGSFDTGTQYFTVRDPRFALALQTTPHAAKPWSANAVRVHDAMGRVVEAALPSHEAHWVGTPTMDSLVQAWAQPFVQSGALVLNTAVSAIERDALDAKRWQLRTSGPGDAQQVFSGFDTVLLAVPAAQALRLLQASALAAGLSEQIAKVTVAPCWTLMLAYPQAVQPTLSHLGPQWNAALSTHHRVAWLARESSKPGRSAIERWTVQASAQWSREHMTDDAARVQAKLRKAFAEVTGIRVDPSHASVQRWNHAKTESPLGKAFTWDARQRIGACGDWCLGHRVEDAFLSGLQLALKVL